MNPTRISRSQIAVGVECQASGGEVQTLRLAANAELPPE